MTTYLRFTDEATARIALSCYVDSDGNWITASAIHDLDPVGALATPGTYDAQGNVLTAPVPLAGWHVNLIGAVPPAAQAYIVTPAAPVRVFAEDDAT